MPDPPREQPTGPDFGAYSIDALPSRYDLRRGDDDATFVLFVPTSKQQYHRLKNGIYKGCHRVAVLPDRVLVEGFSEDAELRMTEIREAVFYITGEGIGQLELRPFEGPNVGKYVQWNTGVFGENADESQRYEWIARAITARAQVARGEVPTGVVAPLPRPVPFANQTEQESIELRAFPAGIRAGWLAAALLLLVTLAGCALLATSGLPPMATILFGLVFTGLTVAAVPIATSIASTRVRIQTDATGVTVSGGQDLRVLWTALKSVTLDTSDRAEVGGFERAWLCFETHAGVERVRVGLGVGRRLANLTQLKQAAEALDARIPEHVGSPEDVPVALRALASERARE